MKLSANKAHSGEFFMTWQLKQVTDVKDRPADRSYSR